MTDTRAEQRKFFILRMRLDQLRHLDRLSVVHDHPLHKLHVLWRTRRQCGPRRWRQYSGRLARRAWLHYNRRSLRIRLLRGYRQS